jgi:hypothetical protein
VHAEVEAAWQRVVEGWDEPARHEAMLGLVARHGEFAWAAARYKERAGDAIADKQLEKLRKAATATLFATATKKRGEDPPYKRTIVIFIVLILMLMIGLLGVKMMHDTRPHPDDAVPRPPAPTTPARH